MVKETLRRVLRALQGYRAPGAQDLSFIRDETRDADLIGILDAINIWLSDTSNVKACQRCAMELDRYLKRNY
ncbi:hypothetical protein GF360_03665 [candidate division WWE3 bacterium]|nr:hypothetical protein [candidate division WWE3 bacterium]